MEIKQPFNLGKFLEDLTKDLDKEVAKQKVDPKPVGRKVPSHYALPIEPIEYIEKNGFDFIEGCIIKYVSRYRFKDGLKDLKKAKDYLEMLIKRESDG